MKEKVKILKGIFSDKIGVLCDSFDYHGNKMQLVRFRKISSATGQYCYLYATVKDGEYEKTSEKEIIQEIKGM